jgi:hypothetical protein
VAFVVSDYSIPMVMRIAKWSFVVAVAAGLILAAWTTLRRTVHAPWSYVVESRFEKMPPNDKALTEWLRSQPGVVPHTVSIGRFEDGKLLYVGFVQCRNMAGQPPFPDLEGHVGSLGYAHSDGPFRDAADRSRTITIED